MSSSVTGFISELFDNEEGSNCIIQFCCRNQINQEVVGNDAELLEEAPAKRQRTAEPADGEETEAEPQVQMTAEVEIVYTLPAHLLVVCGGSPRFRAQAAQWKQQHGPSGSKPVFRVELNAPEELAFAGSALRFMYTNGLDVSGAGALLRVRRFGGELQITGCVAACDAALTALVASPADDPGNGLADVFLHRANLPSNAEGLEAVRLLLHACRDQLVRHSDSLALTDAIVAGGPSLGEVLAWAFLDAPSLLSDPTVRKQLCALPAAAMEALLACDNFATDDEATVLLVLAHWLRVNATASNPTRDRLCKLIRVSQLSDTYLHIILPELPWFPISRVEHHFLCTYVHASPAKRQYIKSSAAGTQFDFGSAWYAAAPRPVCGTRAIASYGWHITENDLKAALATATDSTPTQVRGCFANGARAVTSRGFIWFPEVSYDKNRNAAGVYLWCFLPRALRFPKTGSLPDVVCPGPASLSVYGCAAAEGAPAGAGASAAGASADGTSAAVAGASAAGTSAADSSADGARAAGVSAAGASAAGTGARAAGVSAAGAGASAAGVSAAGSSADGAGASAAAEGAPAGGGDSCSQNSGRKVVWRMSFAHRFVGILHAMGDVDALKLALPVAVQHQQLQLQQLQAGDVEGGQQAAEGQQQLPAGDVEGSQQAAEGQLLPVPPLQQQQQPPVPQQPQGAAAAVADPLAPWAPYLHESKLHGVLQWGA